MNLSEASFPAAALRRRRRSAVQVVTHFHAV